MNVDVLVVGAGPAGLAAAAELRRLGAGRVLVLDRDDAPGGVPRHSDHLGYGIRDRRRLLAGPVYARACADAAVRAGAQIRVDSTVTGWDGPRRLTVTSPAGLEVVQARAVLLATGCRERPRAARLVPGDRPPGVMTTGELQRRVHLGGQRLTGRALVVGAEHVSFSAMVTLAHAGAQVVALVTEHPRHQSYAAFAFAAAARWRVPVWTSTAVSRVVGRGRLAGVELADTRTGEKRFAACDTLVFTGDWIPDHELARLGGLDVDAGTRGPSVDTALETSQPMVFAAGNLVHAAETADVAALGGRHAARRIAAELRGDGREARRVPVTVAAPLAWISPNAVRVSARESPPGELRRPGRVDGPGRASWQGQQAVSATWPARGRFALRGAEFRRGARIEVHQDGRLLERTRPLTLIPGRPAGLSARWVDRVDAAGGPVVVRLS